MYPISKWPSLDVNVSSLISGSVLSRALTHGAQMLLTPAILVSTKFRTSAGLEGLDGKTGILVPTCSMLVALGHSHGGQTKKQNVLFLGGEGQFIVEINASLRINAMPTGSQSDWGIWRIGSLIKVPKKLRAVEGHQGLSHGPLLLQVMKRQLPVVEPINPSRAPSSHARLTVPNFALH